MEKTNLQKLKKKLRWRIWYHNLDVQPVGYLSSLRIIVNDLILAETGKMKETTKIVLEKAGFLT